MNINNLGKINLRAIRFSLGLKVVISLGAFYSAIISEEPTVSLLYLVVAIVFVGLFLFQLRFYKKKKAEMEKGQI